jgi:hypothetical protein
MACVFKSLDDLIIDDKFWVTTIKLWVLKQVWDFSNLSTDEWLLIGTVLY